MRKKYVLIKHTKEKLEVIEEFTQNNTKTTKIKNTKGQFFNIPSIYLILYKYTPK